MKNRTTPELITTLQPNEIFVFGSNLAGRHGAGAAKQALEFGAEYRQGYGIWGKTYAIPTKDNNLKVLDLYEIQQFVNLFIECAIENYDKKFLVTKIGCGLAGYTPNDIAPLFREAIDIPNIHLPADFWEVLNK